MRHSLIIAVSAGLAATLSSSGFVEAQEAKLVIPRVEAQGLFDVGVKAMIREMEVKAKENERVFAKLKALQPPVPPALVIDAVGRVEFVRFLEERENPAVIIVRERVVTALPTADDDEGEEGPKKIGQPRQRIHFPEGFFDKFVLGAAGGAGAARTRLNEQLAYRLRRIESEYQITLAAEQKEKLQLAGRGDIERFLDRVDEKRRIFESMEADMDIDQYRQFQLSIAPLRITSRTMLFTEGSLFSKTLKKIVEKVKATDAPPK